MLRIFFYGGPEHLTERIVDYKPWTVLTVPVFDPLQFQNYDPKNTEFNIETMSVKTHQYYLMREIRLKNNDTLYFFISEDVYGRY